MGPHLTAFTPPSTLPSPKKAPDANAAMYRSTNMAPINPSCAEPPSSLAQQAAAANPGMRIRLVCSSCGTKCEAVTA